MVLINAVLFLSKSVDLRCHIHKYAPSMLLWVGSISWHSLLIKQNTVYQAFRRHVVRLQFSNQHYLESWFCCWNGISAVTYNLLDPWLVSRLKVRVKVLFSISYNVNISCRDGTYVLDNCIPANKILLSWMFWGRSTTVNYQLNMLHGVFGPEGKMRRATISHTVC